MVKSKRFGDNDVSMEVFENMDRLLETFSLSFERREKSILLKNQSPLLG